MFKHRTGWLKQFAGRSEPEGQRAGDRPEPLEALEALLNCVHDLADHSRRCEGARDPALLRLREATGVLVERLTTMLAGPDRLRALYEERQPWPKVDPGLLDALLAAGDQALRAGAQALSLDVCAAVLAAKPNSRAGWRLRARTMEALGDTEGAVRAHQEYLKLVRSDEQGIEARVGALRAREEVLKRCAGILRGRAAGEDASDAPVEEQWAAGLALYEQGRWDEADPRLAGAVLRLIDQGRPPAEVKSALDDYVGVIACAGSARLAEARPLVEAFTDYLRSDRLEPERDPEEGRTRAIGVSDFRNLVSGRTICLVANSERVRSARAGDEIDSYDLVVRFNSYAIDAPATGTRTDIHATIHKHDFNWAEPVRTRLVFGGLRQTWQQSVRRRLVPGAQEYVGDHSLRWPVVDGALIGDTRIPSIPTTGFNMLRLLDFLDVNPRIDLIGFDFYETGAYRLPEAMKLPITPVHAYDYEREWVLAHARETTDMRISLR